MSLCLKGTGGAHVSGLQASLPLGHCGLHVLGECEGEGFGFSLSYALLSDFPGSLNTLQHLF